ncbi:MAG: primase-helicase family protein [Steroidobacteraceae bacterium]
MNGEKRLKSNGKHAHDDSEKGAIASVEVPGGCQTAPAGVDLPPPTTLPPSPIETQVVEAMNAQHAVITMGGNTRVMTIQPSMTRAGAVDLEFAKKADFELRYCNQSHVVGLTESKTPKPIVKTAAEIWLNSPSRRQYERLIFDPARKPQGDEEHRVFNLWRGFPYLHHTAGGSWRKFHKFIEDVICEGNKEHARWVIGWMARCLQRPWEPAGVALVLRGEQGIGKGFFANHFGKLYDPTHFVPVQKRDHLTGKFNALLRDALLVFVDEAFFAGDPTIKGPLKAMITEPIVVIEHKGVDPIQFPNMRAFILASNNDLVVPAEMDARRWAVFNVSCEHAGDRAYFADIARELEAGGYGAMMRDLMDVDLNACNPYKGPLTEALIQQKELSLTSAEKFLFDALMRGEYPLPFDGWVPWPLKDAVMDFSKDQAVRSYLETLHGQHTHASDIRACGTVLGMTIKRLFPSARSLRKRVKNKHGIEERVWVWEFPSLEEARDIFGKKLGDGFDWG